MGPLGSFLTEFPNIAEWVSTALLWMSYIENILLGFATSGLEAANIVLPDWATRIVGIGLLLVVVWILMRVVGKLAILAVGFVIVCLLVGFIPF